MLQSLYDGPFAIVKRKNKNFVIREHGKNIIIAITTSRSDQTGIFAFRTINRCGRNTINNNAKMQSRQNTEHWSEEQSKNTSIPEERTGEVTRAGRRVQICRPIPGRQ